MRLRDQPGGLLSINGISGLRMIGIMMIGILSSSVQGFLPTPVSPYVHMCGRGRIRHTAIMAGTNVLEPGSTAVVVGYRGGVAELITWKITESYKDIKVRAIFENAPGGSTSTGELPAGIDVIYRDLSSISQGDVTGASAAFVSLDKGSSVEIGASLDNYVILPNILASLPSSSAVLVSAYTNDTTGASGPGLPIKFFNTGVNPKEAVENVRSTGAGPKAFLVQHGRLFGDLPGRQPLPFLSGPLQNPVVEESYQKQNGIVALGSSLARPADAATSRTVLAEAMVRSAASFGPSTLTDFSVLSLEGPAPSKSDWEKQIDGLDTRRGVTVFEKQLAANERVDLPVLQEWLVNDFGTSLSTLEVSRILSSPKPSVVVNTNVGSDIMWQFIDKDLKVSISGRWCIQLDKEASTVKILRVDAKGGMLTEALPGEEEVLQRFSAAINRLVYSKKLSKRR